jgi:hypothetical protein
MKAVYSNVSHYNEDSAQIVINVRTKHKWKTRQIKFELDYDCIPYVRQQLAKVWRPVCEQKQRKISQISEAVGS